MSIFSFAFHYKVTLQRLKLYFSISNVVKCSRAQNISLRDSRFVMQGIKGVRSNHMEGQKFVNIKILILTLFSVILNLYKQIDSPFDYKFVDRAAHFVIYQSTVIINTSNHICLDYDTKSWKRKFKNICTFLFDLNAGRLNILKDIKYQIHKPI